MTSQSHQEPSTFHKPSKIASMCTKIQNLENCFDIFFLSQGLSMSNLPMDKPN